MNADLPHAPPPAPAEPALDRHRDALKQRFPLPAAHALHRTPPLRRTAVALLLAMLGAGGLSAWDPGGPASEYQTGTDGRRRIALADDSQLLLDASSRVRVRQHLRSRRVELLAGRARFEVVHSAWRTFQVDTGAVRIRNYGTVFDVARQGDGSKITLWKGQVGVSVNGIEGERRLRPGQQLLASAHGMAEPQPAEAARAGWTQGRLAFVGTPLGEVVGELQRYHRGRIVLVDPGLANLQVSGSFDSDRAASVLALLPDILPVQVQAQDDGSVRIAARRP